MNANTVTGRAHGPLGMRRALRLALTACAIGAALAGIAAGGPALAMQVLDAVDHAELEAQVSATAVSRIALSNDRIARVIRSPGGFETEHDPGSGDLYLRPPPRVDAPGIAPGNAAPGEHDDYGDYGEYDGTADAAPVALFIGTEKGFTYRLTLTVAERGSAQILIRNAAAMPGTVADREAGDPRIGALVALVRAVARREPLAGFAIDAARTGDAGAWRLIETWRGPRFEARVVEIAEEAFAGGTGADAAGLAARLGPGSEFGAGPDGSGAGPGIAAAWLAGPGTGPQGGRIAVLVRETRRASAGGSR